MTNDDRDRLLTRLETLVEVLMAKMLDVTTRLYKSELQIERITERQSGSASWRGAVIKTTLVILGLIASIVLGILALILRR